MNRVRGLLLLFVAVAAVVGCGSSGASEEGRVRGAAIAFAQNVADGNIPAACALADVTTAKCTTWIKDFQPEIARRSIGPLKKSKVEIKGNEATVTYDDQGDTRSGVFVKRHGKWLIGQN